MEALSALRERIPDQAKDLRLNIQSVLSSDKLTRDHRWGIAIASACFVRHERLRDALLADARAAGVPEAVVDDAKAAAALMAMNTVYYRFRHLVGKETYSQIPARLRMQRMGAPATDKTTFELFSLACSALAGCETCLRNHEAAVVPGALTADQVNDAVRIAAVVNGVAVALTLEDANAIPVTVPGAE